MVMIDGSLQNSSQEVEHTLDYKTVNENLQAVWIF